MIETEGDMKADEEMMIVEVTIEEETIEEVTIEEVTIGEVTIEEGMIEDPIAEIEKTVGMIITEAIAAKIGIVMVVENIDLNM